MLISLDLLRYWQKMIPPPAQLCCCRVLGSDNQFLLRVRHGDVHLEMPLQVPLLASAAQVTEALDIDKIGQMLATMGAMVIKPGKADIRGWCPEPEPIIMHPAMNDKWYYEY